MPAIASAAISIVRNVVAHRAAEASHVAEVLLVVERVDDRPGAEEQARLEEGVRDEVEDAGGDRARRRRR